MHRVKRQLFPAFFLLFAVSGAISQTPATGTLEVTGRIRVGKDVEKITRKRFYLIRGGLADNKALIDRLKAANVTSRDCFYCNIKASREYLEWLRSGNCESPFCREITADDIAKVPEFQAAYQKGVKQYCGKTDVAARWVTTNMAPEFRDGFYNDRKALSAGLLGDTKPLQSSMTDSVTVKAIFIDIALQPKPGKTTETFLVSNLIPIEIGSKSYVWACEVEIGANKTAKLTPADAPETSKLVKKCEVIVRELPACAAGVCTAK